MGEKYVHMGIDYASQNSLTVGCYVTVDCEKCDCWLHKVLERTGIYKQPPLRWYEIVNTGSSDG